MQGALSYIRAADAAGAVLSPIRQRVLHVLREPGSATTVGDRLRLPRQKVNYHLRALERLGLVEHVEDRRRGNCIERIVRATASHYLIDPSVLGDLDAAPDAVGDRLSSDHLAAVSARTVAALAELRERADAAGKRLPTFSLETAVRFASAEEQSAFVEELSNAVARLVARHHDQQAPGGRWFRVVLGAHPALSAGRAAEADDGAHATHPSEQAEPLAGRKQGGTGPSGETEETTAATEGREGGRSTEEERSS